MSEASVVGSISILMKAKTNDFKKAMTYVGGLLDWVKKKIFTFQNAVIGIGAALGIFKGWELIKATAQQMDDLGDSAARLGLSVKAFQELRYATELTGSSMESLAGSLTKMNIQLAEAASTGKGGAFDALKKLGLDAKTLVEAAPDQAFLKIAAALAEVQNPAERAGMAVDIFGKSATEILNTLSAGGKTLEDLRKEFNALGGGLSQLDVDKAGALNDSFFRLSTVFDAAKVQLTNALLPAVNYVLEALIKLTDSGFNVGEVLKQGFRNVAVILDVLYNGLLLPIWKVFSVLITVVGALLGVVTKTFYILEAGFNKLTGSSSTFFASMSEGLDDFTNFMGGQVNGQGFGMHLTNFLDQAGKGAGDLGSAFVDSEKKMNAFKNGVVDTQQKVKDLIKDLQLQVDTFGKSDGAVTHYKAQLEGATQAQLAQIDVLDKQLQALEAQKKATEKQAKAMEELKKFAEDAVKDSMTPLEKFKDQMGKLQKAKDAGFLTDAQFKKAGDKAKNENDLNPELKFAGALDANSTEARTAILKATTGKRDDNTELKTIAQTNKEVVNNTAKTTTILDQLLKRAIDNVISI